MPDFSYVIPESHQNVSARILETLIQTQRKASFSGLMRLNHFPDENLVVSFWQGAQEKLYRCQRGIVEILPKVAWPEALARDPDFVGLLPLPVEAMRFMRVAHEVPVCQVEHSAMDVGQLSESVGKWAAASEPSILHVQGDRVNRYYLIAGDSTPVIEELSVWEGEGRFSLNNLSFPSGLPKLEYQVVRYISVHDHDVWREHELRLAMTPYIYMLLNRFSELVGRALTERLCEQLSVWVTQKGWNVAISSNGLVNREYFDSLETAIGFYVGLLGQFQAESSPALGPRMTESITQEVLLKLDGYRRELLEKNVFHWIGAGSGNAEVWR